MSSCDCDESKIVRSPAGNVVECGCSPPPAESVAMREAREDARKAKSDAIDDIRAFRADPNIEMSDEEARRLIAEIEFQGTVEVATSADQEDDGE